MTGGRRPDGDDADGLVTCVECGKRFKSLGPHLFRIHHLSAVDYREMHDLPATTALMATSTRERLSEAHRALLEERPELVAQMRAAALPPEELARRSAEARPRTDGLPRVREARRLSARQQHAGRDVERDRRALRLGYASWEDAITQTMEMTVREATWLLEISPSALATWRQRTRRA